MSGKKELESAMKNNLSITELEVFLSAGYSDDEIMSYFKISRDEFMKTKNKLTDKINTFNKTRVIYV
ncbi:MAG: hypothetical protein IKY94_05490 [Lachnospiraceae bacterium]|nr:hypothetical protein [Lachnospiraceae bacterium]